ncbi:ribonuclease HI [Blattabacterium cuenoti]|uniref:ribonuclease HI n=1 Tax=Blattabacterium cuenoti TaxID=1653831 RepID=UPI00163CE3EF|nr:ribonuclease H [Blattabacterium cuenoti]
MKKKIHIYTDGSSKGNPGIGGYGVFIEIFYKNYYKKIIISEGFRFTTNNRMELLAVIIGLEKIKKKNIIVFTDSKYIVNTIQKGWIYKWKKDNFLNKKNVDLWKRLLNVFDKRFIFFHWIKSHNNHYINDYCDRLSIAASKNILLKIDYTYEKQNYKDKNI